MVEDLKGLSGEALLADDIAWAEERAKSHRKTAEEWPPLSDTNVAHHMAASRYDRIISRLKAGEAPVGEAVEPVAWMLRRPDGSIIERTSEPTRSRMNNRMRSAEFNSTSGLDPFPVFAHPPSTGEPIGWQDIVSAPKDGTRIIGLLPHNKVAVIWWELNEPDWVDWQDDADSEPKATHWMPMPVSRPTGEDSNAGPGGEGA